ncbi:hypothetical protein [Agromyces albus]|uniref:Uncharacterized protein n=1 Tax=Agromyces albus TaxID=205332 RepID=A0A4Q2KWV2_9MICO|nr:hypothetical protein [Agromyces albus]RXZ68312.1 hypothetical protein ESP51_14180 [Agromyces albus]
MADAQTGLEPTIEITDDDYPEIMRIMASDGEIDKYLGSVGIEPDVFEGTEVDTTVCAQERAALGGSLRYVVESAGEATGSLESVRTIIVPLSTATSLLGSLGEVSNEGLRLVDCLEEKRPEAAAKIRETFELLGLDDDRLRREVDQRSAGG